METTKKHVRVLTTHSNDMRVITEQINHFTENIFRRDGTVLDIKLNHVITDDAVELFSAIVIYTLDN